ncbi:hypothetical protein NMG60_11022265 [Bertholletia excelsa]
MTSLMASAIYTPTHLCSSSTTSLAASVQSYRRTQSICLISQLGRRYFSPWSGLRHLGLSISPRHVRKVTSSERRRQYRGMVVYASLFGVGAPEALVIGVVALLVFGPKGLAEVARNLGKTLRAFQPTIRELQEVSREFKSSLEREIGLDEIRSSTQNTYSSKTTSSTSASSSVSNTENSETAADPNGAPTLNRAYSSEEYLKITEEQLRASAAQQQMQISPQQESQPEQKIQQQDAVKEAERAAAAEVAPLPKPESKT